MNWLASVALTLGVIQNGEYHLGIGDPTPFAWVVVVAYVAAATLSLAVALRDRRRGEPKGIIRFWFVLAAALLLLGVNKQLDLQTWFTQVGRHLAQNEGWFDYRRPVQLVFILLIGICGTLTLGLAGYVLRGRRRRMWMPITGIVFLVTFVIIRAASFHHIDRLLHAWHGVWGLNQSLELGGNVLIACGAVREWRRPINAQTRSAAADPTTTFR